MIGDARHLGAFAWVEIMDEATDGVADTLRVGVVGIGVMGSNHARVLPEMPGVELVGVADPDRSRPLLSAARSAARLYRMSRS